MRAYKYVQKAQSLQPEVTELTILNSIDANECSDDNPCDRNATCTNFIGSYNCTCNEGFQGDGINCEGTAHASVMYSTP